MLLLHLWDGRGAVLRPPELLFFSLLAEAMSSHLSWCPQHLAHGEFSVNIYRMNDWIAQSPRGRVKNHRRFRWRTRLRDKSTFFLQHLHKRVYKLPIETAAKGILRSFQLARNSKWKLVALCP